MVIGVRDRVREGLSGDRCEGVSGDRCEGGSA